MAFLGTPVIVALASQVNNMRALMATLRRMVILFQNSLKNVRVMMSTSSKLCIKRARHWRKMADPELSVPQILDSPIIDGEGAIRFI